MGTDGSERKEHSKMCGIAGYIDRSERAVDPEVLRSMVQAVWHRGPDGGGQVVTGSVGLGHRRLAILDPTPMGAQPMWSSRSDCVIVFNGEIYNFIELRDELRCKGAKFSTNSDTEVILAAYDEWGVRCVDKFNGMWAFAIHDLKKQIVFCSRDRFGVKPFYYTCNPRLFAFGSEIRQLLPLLDSTYVCEEVLQDFLITGVCEHRPETFYRGVLKLPAGHNLVYRTDDNSFSIQRFYRLEKIEAFASASEEEAVERYRAYFHDAVHLRLRSDVPVGTCLSGGIDSSSVAAIAASSYFADSGRQFSAITAVSEDPRNDESRYAREVAEHLSLNWIKVESCYEDFSNSVDAVATAQEEPFPGPSIFMQYFVMRAARQAGLPVLLDGQGGDETLLGYERYFAAHFLSIFRNNGILPAMSAMLSSWRNNAKMSPRIILAYIAYFSFWRMRYRHLVRRNAYMRNTFGLPGHVQRYAYASRDVFELQKLEIEHTNLPALLRYEDKNSMHYSVETRLPFLDYRSVELALSLPGSAKIHRGWTKHVLRKAMTDVLPANIVWRKDKRGFEAPETIWLERHRQKMLDTVASSHLLRCVCGGPDFGSVYGRLDIRTRWRLYSVALWERLFNVTVA